MGMNIITLPLKKGYNVHLHLFLYGDEHYNPSSKVKEISQKISEDSGLYEEGEPAPAGSGGGSSGGNSGTAQSPTEAPAQTVEETTAEETTAEETTEEETTAEETLEETEQKKRRLVRALALESAVLPRVMTGRRRESLKKTAVREQQSPVPEAAAPVFQRPFLPALFRKSHMYLPRVREQQKRSRPVRGYSLLSIKKRGWNTELSGVRVPAFYISGYHCMKKTVFGAGVFAFQLPDQVFYIFPFGVSVCRTGIFAYGKLVFSLKTQDIRLLDQHHWPDHG